MKVGIRAKLLVSVVGLVAMVIVAGMTLAAPAWRAARALCVVVKRAAACCGRCRREKQVDDAIFRPARDRRAHWQDYGHCDPPATDEEIERWNSWD